MSEQNGIQWLVEERDRLKARVAVLENELVRRDAAGPRLDGAFFVQVFPEQVMREMHSSRDRKNVVADYLVHDLAKEVVRLSLHTITKMPDGTLRLYFLATPLNVDSLSRP